MIRDRIRKMVSGILIASIHMGRLKMLRKVNAIRIRMEARSFRFMAVAPSFGLLDQVTCNIYYLLFLTTSDIVYQLL